MVNLAAPFRELEQCGARQTIVADPELPAQPQFALERSVPRLVLVHDQVGKEAGFIAAQAGGGASERVPPPSGMAIRPPRLSKHSRRKSCNAPGTSSGAGAAGRSGADVDHDAAGPAQPRVRTKAPQELLKVVGLE
jgi:hypothetical protein